MTLDEALLVADGAMASNDWGRALKVLALKARGLPIKAEEQNTRITLQCASNGPPVAVLHRDDQTRRVRSGHFLRPGEQIGRFTHSANFVIFAGIAQEDWLKEHGIDRRP